MRKLELGTPVILGNMLLIPILGDECKLEVIPLEEGQARGLRIKETGAIDRAVVENPLEYDVFVMDGEELLGARQDRIAVHSEVVSKESEIEIDVVCVEKGRWEGEGDFRVGFTAFPRLRMSLSFGSKDGLQETVWSLVDRKLETLRISSATRSLHHSFLERESELELYTHWEPEDGAVGVMAFSNRGFLCCDIFSDRKLFLSLKDKLLKGYALDALEDRIRGRSFNIDINRAVRYWKDIEGVRRVLRNERETSVEEVLSGERVRGKRLVYQEVALHETFFPK